MAGNLLAQGKLRLWTVPAACSLVPHIMLRRIGADFELIKLNLSEGFPEEFRKINPKMRVPVLAIGDEVVTELPAIATAISYIAPDQHLLGQTALETIRVSEWLNWLSGTMHSSAFGAKIRPQRYSNDAKAWPDISAKGQEWIQECCKEVEQRLNGPSVVSSGFTAADYYLFVMYRWAAAKEGIDMAPYPKYTALFKAVRDEPAVRAALEEEGVKLSCD